MYALITCKRRGSKGSSSRCHRIATVDLISKTGRSHADGRHGRGLHGSRAVRTPSNLDHLTCKQPDSVAHRLRHLHGGSCHQPKDRLELHGSGENHTAHAAAVPPRHVLQGRPSVEAFPARVPDSAQCARSVLSNQGTENPRDFSRR